MRLLSLFGLDRRLRRLRIAAGEGALAAEDRAKLLKLAWDEERQRLRLVLGLSLAVIGLTTVTVALLSVAVVVHFWDTPSRVPAAWAVAGVWLALWLVAAVALMNTLRRASTAFEPALREFERDWEWVQAHFHASHEDADSSREPRPLSREELLARIARQRARIATLESAASEAAEPAPDEPASAVAVRMAREHPVATGALAAAAAVVIGPRRLLRWAVVIGPVLWRMR
ncbi:putative membrane protein [Variovorax sp. PBS-H4]|uniref:phage holin family protein n=1 Tax=Variovorax sp. PBS-H4 TaxID=434008 RepID=UPI00131771BC|nr:phage holin family protein [Variovorax sp. PBS-H4]VTU37063.1 putative membrane protein [Variovorax sp. PBS-H4]